MLPVHFVNQFVNLSHQIMVALYMGAARGGYLDKHELSNVLRIFLKKTVNRLNSFHYAFCVVNSFHSQTDYFTLQLILFSYRLHGFKIRGSGLVRVVVHAYRESPDEGLFIGAHNAELLRVHSGLKKTICRIKEIIAVILDMKPYKIASQHAVKNFLLIRTY